LQTEPSELNRWASAFAYFTRFAVQKVLPFKMSQSSSSSSAPDADVPAPSPALLASSNVVLAPNFDVPISKFYVKLKDFRRIERIGTGSYAGVYSARSKITGELVAIKKLSIIACDPRQAEFYRREVLLLATLRHPAILPLVGCTPFESNKSAAIVTPLMKGSLQSYIASEVRDDPPPRWTPTHKHVVLLGIAAGMAFMHENRCIHRDLKPANVLLDENSEPRICDFGLSKLVEQAETLCQSMHGGTPQFMAPEILMGDTFDFKVDVYAFAMLMYVVLTGQNPWPEWQHPVALARKALAGERPVIPATVNPAYRSLITSCWATAPGHRPEFRDVVAELIAGPSLVGLDVDVINAYAERVWPSKTPLAALSTAAPLETLRARADSGDARSQVLLGERLEKREGAPEEAVRYYQRAADQNYPEGLVALGQCLRRGVGIEKDEKQAVALFERASAQNCPDGHYRLAECLRYGRGCHRNLVEAARLLKLAADAGHGRAANDYGFFLERGVGVAQDHREALRYYRTSVDHNCPAGMIRLADMYREGKQMPRDVHEAVRLYEAAAAAGGEEAFFALCQLYRDGEGPLRPNQRKALEIARRSAERGHFRGLVQYAELLDAAAGEKTAEAEALFERAHGKEFAVEQNNFAVALNNGNGCAQHSGKAAKYFKIAANNGNLMAMVNLARCYSDGTGVAQDRGQAAQWFKRSADAGSAVGCAAYGRCLRLGIGVPVDFVCAREYLIKGAMMEDCQCYGDLAHMYVKGEGGRKDYEEAFKYFRLAAGKGLPSAIFELGRMHETGKGVQASFTEAVTLYRQAYQLGDVGATERLGRFYATGRGVTKNIGQARRLLEKAVALGSTTAAAAIETLCK
jgi:TPR repeat protein